MIARGLMTIEKKRKLEKEEEDESSDDYDVWSGVVNQAELDRLDGIVSEHLAVFEVSEFLLTMTASTEINNYKSIGAAIPASRER